MYKSVYQSAVQLPPWLLQNSGLLPGTVSEASASSMFSVGSAAAPVAA